MGFGAVGGGGGFGGGFGAPSAPAPAPVSFFGGGGDFFGGFNSFGSGFGGTFAGPAQNFGLQGVPSVITFSGAPQIPGAITPGGAGSFQPGSGFGGVNNQGGAGGPGGLGGLLKQLGKSLGQVQQANAAASAANAQAAGFEANAKIAQINAAAALEAGRERKERRERIGKAKLAKNAVSYLKGGVVLSGSPLAVLGENALQEALAAQDELFEGQVEATRFQNQAILQNFYAGQARSKASRIKSQAAGGIGTSLLGSIGGIFR